MSLGHAPSEDQRHALAIALIGHFNPQILKPAWFARAELLDVELTKSADVLVDSPQIVSYVMDGLSVEVTPERCLVYSESVDHFDDIVALVVSTFKILAHTPITVVGLSRHVHVRMPSDDAAEQFLDTFAPRAPWEGVNARIGDRRLEVEHLPADDEPRRGLVEVSRSDELTPGIYVGVSEETEVADADADLVQGLDACERLPELWTHLRATFASVTRATLGF